MTEFIFQLQVGSTIMNVCESNARSNIDMRISACPWHVRAACLSIIARQLALQNKMTMV